MILTSRRQRRVLTVMHDSLRGSDPRLVAAFATFTRLTSDEAMPQVERVRPGPVRWLASAARRGASFRRRARGRRAIPARDGRAAAGYRGVATVQGRTPVIIRNRIQSALFIPLLAAALLAIVFLMGRGQAQASCPASEARQLGTSRHLTVLPRQYLATAACPASQTLLVPRHQAGQRR